MGNQQSKQRIAVANIFGCNASKELLFHGYMRRIEQLMEADGQQIPHSIVQVCFEFYANQLYQITFERILYRMASQWTAAPNIEILLKVVQILMGDPTHFEHAASLLSGGASVWSKKYLMEIGFSEDLQAYKPATRLCLETALNVLNRFKLVFDGQILWMNAEQLIWTAMQHETPDLWQLILISLPAFCLVDDEQGSFDSVKVLKILKENQETLNRERVANNIAFWMTQYWFEDFQDNEQLQALIEQDWVEYEQIDRVFLQQQVKSEKTESAKIEGKEQKQEANAVLYSVSSKNIAEQLTKIHYELYRNIKPRELVYWSKGQRESGPNVKRCVDHFNALAKWLQFVILSAPSLKKRTQICSKIIGIGAFLRAMRNYYGLMIVYSALDSVSVCRLKKMRQKLSEKMRREAEEWRTDIFSRNSGWEKLRQVQGDSVCIPYLGLVLQDLMFLFEGGRKDYRTSLRMATHAKSFLLFPETRYDDLETVHHIQQALLAGMAKKEITDEELHKLARIAKDADGDAK